VGREKGKNCVIITYKVGPENKELIKIVLGQIHERGKIPFVDFMELVLYHPEQGYYNSPREKIGPEGDFYTGSDVHPILGQLIARQLHQMWEILGFPSPFHIVETGAGKGLLCSDILKYCRGYLPRFYQDVLYILAEKSPALEERQRALLLEFSTRGKARWVKPEALFDEGGPFVGCFLSNELIDSFPIHLVQKEAGELREVYVIHEENGFKEILGPPSTPLLSAYLQAYGSPFQEGQRGEINLKALDWIAGVSRVLQRGFVLTIDYGYEAAELYHPARREGTLLCYFRHTISPNPYQRIGYQDMTSHVNFSALMKRGEAVGLRKVGYTEQYKFLAALGLLADLENFEKSFPLSSVPEFLQNKLAMKSLLIPGGMGRVFKVLAQSKGIGEAKLLGFKDPFPPRER